MTLEPGHSAVVFSPDGEVLYCVVPDESEEAPASRAIMVAMAMMVLGRERIDALVEEALRSASAARG